ncbi:MAG: PQQ-binding-like beta-propeller repeat protein [Candidatus Aenigmarchaeota archaeon]|nr:PQQ-binding-like beta-propeller repeat protein [Candidatus Aenigmarchaeota archaeon]
MVRYAHATMIFFILIFLPASSYASGSMTMVQKGITGSIVSEKLAIADIDGNGEDSVIMGTTTGLFIIDGKGMLDMYIQTSSSVNTLTLIDDITGDGRGDIVLGTADIYFPNVQCYDTSTGEKMWEFSPRTEVYDSFILWTMKQTAVFDMITVNDMNGDGTTDIAVSAGYVLYALDGKTGDVLWSFGSTDNIWDVDVSGDYAIAGDQNGYVYAFSMNGEKIWETLVSDTYTVRNPNTNSEVGKVTRSVWDIVPLKVGGKDAVAVSAEDGYVHLLDLETGKIIWETGIIEYVDTLLYSYYGDNPMPTSIVSYNFLNMRIGSVSDITGDGDDDIAVYTYPGRRNGDYKGAVEGIYMLASDDGRLLWKNENADLAYSAGPVTLGVGEEYIALPQGKSSGKQKIKLIKASDGTAYETIGINTTSQGRPGRVIVSDAGSGKFVITSGSDDITMVRYPEKVLWSFPRITDVSVIRSDFTGDETTDILVRSREGADQENAFDAGQTRIMFVIDGATREVAWSYEMPSEMFIRTGGLSGLIVVPRSDGKSDLAAYVQEYGDWNKGDMYGENSRILRFSGKTGSILMNTSAAEAVYYGAYNSIMTVPGLINETFEYKVATEWEIDGRNPENVPTSKQAEFYVEVNRQIKDFREMADGYRIKKRIEWLDLISDQSSDDLPDFLISSWDDVFIKDGVTGEDIWNRTNREYYYTNPFTGDMDYSDIVVNWTESDRGKFIAVGDANGDGADELVLATWDSLTFLHSSSGPLNYEISSTETFAQGFNKDCVTKTVDINGNGAKDIVYEKYQKDAPSMFVFADGRNGYIILEAEKSGTSAEISGYDFNGNGFNDFITFSLWTDGGGPKLEVIDGRSNDIIWSYDIDEGWMLRDMFGYSTVMPAAPAGDMNGDGVTDIALVRSQAWQPGCEIMIYDVKNGEKISDIVIEDIDNTRSDSSRWMPGIKASLLSDVTGDSIDELGIIALVGDSGQKQVKMYIIDIANGEIVSDFSTIGTEMIDIEGESVGIVGSSGNIYFLDITRNLRITSPVTGSVTGSPLKIEWSGDTESITTVMVDGSRVVMTDDSSAEFEMPSGDHKVSVYSSDRYGKGTYDTIDVTVEKDSSSVLFVTIAVVMLIVLLFSSKLMAVIKR